ncbi:MAG: iron chelate uptake ABC transporter family permease subunit [bacterium]|nr:iron chelate uptake ABC transporter family permease subunit [bacterium]
MRKKYAENKAIIIITVLTAVLMIAFIMMGLTERNINYFLPKRLIKMWAVLLVSYCIGYSAVTFQTITNNKILTPSVMGLDSLYLFIQTFVVFFFGSGTLNMMTGYTQFFISVGAMVGMSFLLFIFLFKGDGKNIYFLVLAGMILGNLFGGMSTFMQVVLDPNEFQVLQGKMFASFNNINTELLGICTVIVALVVITTYRDLKYLDVISLGQDHAINLGVPYKRVVMKTLIVISIVISISTVLVGPITFLGILVVSLSREMQRTFKHTKLVIGATVLGAFALTFSILLVERVFAFETTSSTIINFVGGIYFIYIMIKESKR